MKNKQVFLLIGVGVLVLAFSLFLHGTSNSRYLAAATLGGDYLVSHMHPDGSFVYAYDPVARKESDSYNILRHAGTTYALLELFDATGQQGYLTAAERALGYLRSSTIPCPLYADTLCVMEDDEIKLGGNGLALLAVAHYLDVAADDPTAAFDTEELATYGNRLARFIVRTQKPSGEFSPHKMDGKGIPDLEFVSEYYPGEAMFALARFSAVTGERQWMDAAHKGAAWIISVRDKDVPTEDLPHDHWMLYALNELNKDKPEVTYVEHAKRLVSAIVAAQHNDKTGEQEAWNGGYYDPPRSTPTATRNEGLGAAYEIFERSGDAAYAVVAKDAMERGIDFTLKTQFTPRTLRQANAANDALGGFHESLDDYAIRIDYVQHNISALLAFDRIRKE